MMTRIYDDEKTTLRQQLDRNDFDWGVGEIVLARGRIKHNDPVLDADLTWPFYNAEVDCFYARDAESIYFVMPYGPGVRVSQLSFSWLAYVEQLRLTENLRRGAE